MEQRKLVLQMVGRLPVQNKFCGSQCSSNLITQPRQKFGYKVSNGEKPGQK
jgi:hypothetical protein